MPLTEFGLAAFQAVAYGTAPGPTQFYVALLSATGNPANGGRRPGFATELKVANYGRQPITFKAATDANGATVIGQLVNANQISFANLGACQILGLQIVDGPASSSTVNVWEYSDAMGTNGQPTSYPTGTTIAFGIGTLRVRVPNDLITNQS